MRLFVMVQGDEIIVTSETGFRVEYWQRPKHTHLKVRRCTETENHELLQKRGKRQTQKRASWDGLRKKEARPMRGRAPAGLLDGVG